MQFDAMELDKALARMDASLHEAFAAKSNLELLLQAKDEHRPPDAGETETLRDRYHDIALSNEALHVNPMDMPKKDGTADRTTRVSCLSAVGAAVALRLFIRIISTSYLGFFLARFSLPTIYW
jgi:hypothetical protein